VTLRTGTAIDVLWNELGADVVTPGAQVDPRYFTAYNEQAGVRPRALVRPTCVAQISRTLEICSRFGQPVVPQGGRTGLARGAVPALPERGEIVLSLERYAGVDELDRAAATVTVRAGTLLQSLQQAVEDAGFSLESTSAHAARARSAAISRPMPAATARFATASCATRYSGSRSCLRTARSSVR